jgi:site-specific recombinase XerD
MPKPFFHKGNGRWAVSYGKGLSGVGKPRVVYYDSEQAASADIKKRERDRRKFGQDVVSNEERTAILFLRSQIGDLSKIPSLVEHWRKTGPEAIEPTTVADAVQKFQDWILPRLKVRTQSDIRYRLNAFSEAFKDAQMHELNAGDLEAWLYGRGSAWSVRSFYKRLLPLFSHAVRHRWIASNPMLLMKAPDVPRESKTVYTGEQLTKLLTECFAEVVPGEYELKHPDYLLPFICLSAFAWMRTSELVRLYSAEDVLCWSDVDLKNNRIHVRSTVGKATRRRSGNERFVGITEHLTKWLAPYSERLTGRIVPVLHHEFAAEMRKLHTDAEVPIIHNGFRRSAISHYLAAHPETGIGELARRAGSSEQTVKKHYLEVLTPEAGEQWFAMEPWQLKAIESRRD